MAEMRSNGDSECARAVAAAVGLVTKGVVYDLECLRWNMMSTWRGHPPFQVVTYRSPHGIRAAQDHQDFLGQNDVQMAWFSEMVIGTVHTGTHIDALGHVVHGDDAHWYGGMNADNDSGDFGLLRGDVTEMAPIVTRGVMIDVAGHLGKVPLPAGYPITVDDIKGALADEEMSITAGDTVLIRTGYMSLWPAPECSQGAGAGITLEVARFLGEIGVVAVGADTESLEVQPSVDPANPHPVHIELLNERAIHIMEMVNQEDLARDKVYEFLFMCSPLKIKGATGSMIRPLAIV